jgi:anaerobic selenocysteine-containing dehydrogenase
VSADGRLLQPLRRTGPKGTGNFQPISWEEALDLIASRFTSIISSHGAEALMPFYYRGSMGIVQRYALQRIFNALGASRIFGDVCGASASVLLKEGHPSNVDPEETPDARLILLWGQNVLTTCHHQWQRVLADIDADDGDFSSLKHGVLLCPDTLLEYPGLAGARPDHSISGRPPDVPAFGRIVPSRLHRAAA